MGVLQLPRLYFQGYNYWNPSTFNNNDYSPPIDTYDPPNAQLNCPYLHSQGVYTESEFQDWSVVPIPYDKPEDKVPPAEWAYYGGNQCGFVTENLPKIQNPNFSKPTDFTHVTGYTDASGSYQNSDSWIDLPLQFNLNTISAKLVDVNPVSFWSSQIFADSFTLGSSDRGFTAPVKYRMHSRWIGSTHNYNATGDLIIAGTFSAVFQTCFHKDDIQWLDAESSTLATQLRDAMASPEVAGLMLRFTNYDTIYFQGDAFNGICPGELYLRMEEIATLYQEYNQAQEDYQKGLSTTKPPRPINHAYSRVVGWIGLWKQGELVSVPEGRLLIPFPNNNGSNEGDDGIKVQAKDLPSYPAQVTLGPATVEVKVNGTDVERLSVDLGTAMPERDSSGQKANFGTVQLGLLLNNEFQLIATLPNDKSSYEPTAGVVDITEIPGGITADNIQNNPLVIQVESYDSQGDSQTPVLALIETPLTAQTDQRGVYVNQPNPSWNTDAEMPTFTVKVQYYGGQPLPGGTTLALTQDENVELFYKDPNETFQPYTQDTQPIPVTRDGEVTIGVRALHPGTPNIAFSPALPEQSYVGAPFNLGNAETVASAFYTVIRCLPFHNAMADSFEEWLRTNPDITQVNQRVFNEVYNTYHLMYPVMDFINSPLKFQEWRGKILRVTSPELFTSSQYMPVTRALSAGQRRILELYDQYLSQIPPRLIVDSISPAKTTPVTEPLPDKAPPVKDTPPNKAPNFKPIAIAIVVVLALLGFGYLLLH
ncbi:MAG: hypothetical protein F6J92_12490 [Symploca sp. SIO1A3]|nr:hypothetical protein [Symploca sp. SIO1A3]